MTFGKRIADGCRRVGDGAPGRAMRLRVRHAPRLLAPAALVAIFVAAVAGAEPLPLLNPGFEDGQNGWRFKDSGMSLVLGDAAHSGKSGLRINDESPDQGSDVACARFVTEPGKKVTARFWARQVEGEGLGVYLRFFKGDGTCLNTKELETEIKVVIPAEARDWQKFEVSAPVPEEAIEGEIWIRSWSHAIVRAELDDFELEQMSGN